MGFQKLHNTEGTDHNVQSNKSSMQRTSKTKELCNSTSKCQYERLGKTGKKEGE